MVSTTSSTSQDKAGLSSPLETSSEILSIPGLDNGLLTKKDKSDRHSKSQNAFESTTQTEAKDQAEHASLNSGNSQELAVAFADREKYRGLAEIRENELNKVETILKTALDEIALKSQTMYEARVDGNDFTADGETQPQHVGGQVLGIPDITDDTASDVQNPTTSSSIAAKSIKGIQWYQKLVNGLYEEALKGGKTEISNLKVEIIDLQNRLEYNETRRYKNHVARLQRELELRKPLFDVGVQVRVGRFETVKCIWVDGIQTVL